MENASEDLRDWILRNWDVTVFEEISRIISKHLKNKIDDVDRDNIADDISSAIKSGIINVINTYDDFDN